MKVAKCGSLVRECTFVVGKAFCHAEWVPDDGVGSSDRVDFLVLL